RHLPDPRRSFARGRPESAVRSRHRAGTRCVPCHGMTSGSAGHVAVGRGDRAAVAGWLTLALVGQLAAFEVVRRLFVDTPTGQRLDTIALAGNSIGQGHVAGLVNSVLNTVSVLSVLVAIVVIGFI